MVDNDVAPHHGVRCVNANGSNVSPQSIGKLFFTANQLELASSTSLSIVDSSISQTPLINVRRLVVNDVIGGLEYLLDGLMLPHLKYIRATVLTLFVAFARRSNQMKTLDSVDQLVIYDQFNDNEKSFCLKHWYLVLDVLPRLRTLLIQIHSPACASIGLAELFLNYIRRTIRSPLTLFSFGFTHPDEKHNKESFIKYLGERFRTEYSFVYLTSINERNLDMWM